MCDNIKTEVVDVLVTVKGRLNCFWILPSDYDISVSEYRGNREYVFEQRVCPARSH